MQEVKEKPEADEGGVRVTVGDPTTTAKRTSQAQISVAQRVSAADENLLDDVIGSKDQAMYDQLLSAGDFENGPIAEVEVETV